MDGNSPNLVTLVSTEIVANCVLEKCILEQALSK
jgi:hypothetical protein